MTEKRNDGNEQQQEPKIRSRIFFKENSYEQEPVVRERLPKNVLRN